MRRITFSITLVWITAILSGCGHLANIKSNSNLSDKSVENSTLQAELATSVAPQGGVQVVRIRVKELDSRGLHVRWQGMEIPALPQVEDPHIHVAAFGIPLDQSPGDTFVRVYIRNQDVDSGELNLPFRVEPRQGKSERLRVKRRHLPRKGRVLSSALKTQPAELKLDVDNLLAPLWRSGFSHPVPGDVTSQFGSNRVYNGRVQGRHLGTDFRARKGDAVRAAAGGRVILARHQSTNGKTVVIDHGLGIFTSYAHLSKIIVKVGQVVEDLALIGLAGNTGRSNGSHLHWGASIHGVKVDPMELANFL